MTGRMEERNKETNKEGDNTKGNYRYSSCEFLTQGDRINEMHMS